MVVTVYKNSKHYIGNKIYNVWLNGGKIKYAEYADDKNGVVVMTTLKNGKLKTRRRRGKVKIVEKT